MIAEKYVTPEFRKIHALAEIANLKGYLRLYQLRYRNHGPE